MRVSEGDVIEEGGGGEEEVKVEGGKFIASIPTFSDHR